MKSIKELVTERRNKSRNKKLIKEFPFLLPRNRWTGKASDDYDYSYTELDEMPDGWRKAFGEQMCQEIKEALIKHNYLDKYRIMQIKEKYGSLRWYDNGAPKEVSRIISKYEDLSMCYCYRCGKPTKYMTEGWIEYFCEDCKTYLISKGYNEDYFIPLKKSDAPQHFIYKDGKQIDLPLDNEVQKVIDENWEED